MNNIKKELSYLDIYLKFIDSNNLDGISFINSFILDNEINLDNENNFIYIDKSVLLSYYSEIKMIK